MTIERVQADADEVVGYGLHRYYRNRDPAHADPDWFQLDLDEPLEDPDEEPVNPVAMTKRRHFTTEP